MQRIYSLTGYLITLVASVAAASALLLLSQLLFGTVPVEASMLAPSQSYTISGTIRNYDNTPMAGGFVSTGWGDPGMDFATSDEQGNYSLTLTTPGTYHLSVSYFYNKLDPAAQTVTVPGDQTIVDFTFSPYETIRGFVVDADGLPLEGAKVVTEFTDPIDTSALTDANGAYAMAVASGVYHVSVSKSGLVSPPAQRIIVPPSHTDVNFAMFVPYTIEGIVRGFDGQPVSGVSVSTSGDDPMRAFGMTGTNGAYSLIVRAGTYHLNASFVGLGTSMTKIVTVPSSQTGIDLELPQQYLIHGTVRDEFGQPVAGASVNEGSAAATTTAADGSYSLSLVAGEHWINSFADESLYDSGRDIVLVSVPDATSNVDFVLRVRTRTIRGRVVDDQGQPVAMATVFATNLLDSTGQANSTAADGTYSVTVPAGVYWVYVVKYSSLFDPNPNRLTVFEPSLSQEIDVTAAPAQDVNFALKPVTGMQTIRGHVLDYQGGPMNAIVSASPIDPNNCNPRQSVSTDASGAYTITVKPGSHLVSVWSEGMPVLPDQTVQVPTAASVDFTYPQVHVIGGRITNQNGKPLEYVLVQVTKSNLNVVYNSTLTASDGWYSVVVAAGSYTVTAYDKGFSNPPAQIVTVLPEHSDIHFTLSPATPPDQFIRGRVLDEQGQPAANAVISLAGELFGGKTVYHDGTFSRAVYPGTYTLTAGGYGYVSSPSQQVTMPGGATDLTFTVHRADHFIFGQVLNQAGDPLCSVKVEAIGDAATSSGLTNSSGRFAMRVPAGDYTIRALATGYPATAQMVTLPPTVTKLQFVLGAAANNVEGTVLDQNGAAVAGASIVASSAGGNVSTITDANGKYTLQLSNGSWKITISGSGLVASPSSQTVTVPPGQSQVDFRAQATSAAAFVYLPTIER